jgi:glycosyltransferase involved in cell wall biosynthesis
MPSTSQLPTPNPKLKIAVLGLRGFPNVQGGVEKHCENLYPQLVKLGCEIVVFGRAPYIGEKPFEYQGIKIIPLPCSKNKFLEAFSHTFRGIFSAKKLNPDIVHIHAIGPALMVPLARMLGLKVIITHHGPDYERKKWNWIAKFVLKIGEYFGVKFSNQIITISQPIADDIKKKYKREAVIIPNGVVVPEIAKTDEVLKKFGIEKGKYLLAVGRFVPEKGFHDLITAFKVPQTPNSELQTNNWKLVIAGDADHEGKYSRELKRKARENKNIVLTGFLTGTPLHELYSHPGIFVLPSYYEGLPIVLLEAMSYGLLCLVSDIPANREVELNKENYFPTGNILELSSKIDRFLNNPLSPAERKAQIDLIAQKYNWPSIAAQTLEVYTKVFA